jgi:hypothetical protein
MNVLINRCVLRSFLAEELVETWQVNYQAAMYSLDLEAVVDESLDLSALLRKSWPKIRELLFDERICDIAGAGKLFEGCVKRTNSLLNRVLGFVHVVEKTGHEIARLLELDCAIKEMKRLKETIEKEWPKIDAKMTEESLADYRRGEYKSVETLLNDLQSYSS